MVAVKQDAAAWGAAVIPRLSLDLRSDLPKIKGFSERNIRRMIQFHKEFPGLFLNWPRPVAKLGDAAARPEIRPQPVAKFDPNDSAQPAQGSGEDQVVQWVVAQLTRALPNKLKSVLQSACRKVRYRRIHSGRKIKRRFDPSFRQYENY